MVAEADLDEALSASHTKSGRLQRACLELIGEHAADGAILTNGRFDGDGHSDSDPSGERFLTFICFDLDEQGGAAA